MTDLLTTLPSFPIESYTHLLPSLEKNLITTSDLLTLGAVEIAKRARLPILDLKRLASHIVEALHEDLGVNGPDHEEIYLDKDVGEEEDLERINDIEKWSTISLLDDGLDDALGGGIPTSYITEVTGESGVGKTQFLLTLLLAVQLSPPLGLSRTAIYVSTEASLPTSRLKQLLSDHPILATLPPSSRPSLAQILTIRVKDLEEQEHILTYQLPIAINRYNVGLVVLDSVAANFRAEQGIHHAKAMANRSIALVKLGYLLRKLAKENDIAIVVANQVSDRFTNDTRQDTNDTRHDNLLKSSPFMTILSSPSPQTSTTSTFGEGILSLDYQQRFFTGWGDISTTTEGLKTPALGLVWTNQIACRIALKFSSHSTNEEHKRRIMRVVFSPWTAGGSSRSIRGEGPEFKIVKEGIHSVNPTSKRL